MQRFVTSLLVHCKFWLFTQILISSIVSTYCSGMASWFFVLFCFLLCSCLCLPLWLNYKANSSKRKTLTLIDISTASRILVTVHALLLIQSLLMSISYMRVHSKQYTFYGNGKLNDRYPALQDSAHSYIISLYLLNVTYSTDLWNVSTIFLISWYSIDRIRLHNLFKLASFSLQYAIKFALCHSMPHSSFRLSIWVMFFFLLHFPLPYCRTYGSFT